MKGTLFTPITIGGLTLSNRIFMAPLTRMRAREPGDVPVLPLMAEYYRQRANAGLIISEATQISPQGKGYMGTPGIFSAEQVALALRRDLRGFADDQAGLGALGVILGHQRQHRHIAGLLAAHARQRRHEDTVGERQRTQGNRGKELAGHDTFLKVGRERLPTIRATVRPG